MKKIHSVSNSKLMIIKTQVEKTRRKEERMRGNQKEELEESRAGKTTKIGKEKEREGEQQYENRTGKRKKRRRETVRHTASKGGRS